MSSVARPPAWLWPVSLNGIDLIFSDSPSDGKPIQMGWLSPLSLT
jgi:hypothetical protein